MQLSPAGILADVFWRVIKNHAKNIELGEFVVMPNHIHRILILHGADAPSTAVPSEKTIGQTRFQNPGKNSISSIIGGYKSAVTKHCNRLGFGNDWQSLFHDHIIRDARAVENIQNYIANNVKNWKEDKFWKPK